MTPRFLSWTLAGYGGGSPQHPATGMSDIAHRARHLKSLLWGQPEGPRSYEELPPELRDMARAVDKIGDDLAEARLAAFQEDDDPDNLVIQVQMLAHVLALQVLPNDLDDVPDPNVVWVRSDFEGERHCHEAFDGALHFLAYGGEPNIWRNDTVVGRPSLKDVRAMQLIAAAIVDAAACLEGANVSPSHLVEDFVRMHWSTDPQTFGLVHGWEDTPFGHVIFDAVRQARHIPAEEAEIVHAEPPGPDRGAAWSPAR